MGIVLNPLVKLRKNESRVLIYKVDEFYHDPDRINPIHPTYAILLSMFDGEKSYDQVLEDFFYVTSNENTEENRKFVEKQLQVIQDELLAVDELLMEKEKAVSLQVPMFTFSPEEFIIPQEKIDVRPYDKRIDFPLSVNYNVSTDCSFNCLYCYHPRFKMDDYLSLDRLNIIFDELRENGCENVTLSGGDPFVRPDLLEILHQLKDRDMNYFLSTKSYLDREVCKRLVDYGGLDRMQISLDAAEPTLAAFLVGGPKDFLEKTIETIENLKQLGVIVRLKCVVNGYNADHLQEYLKLCEGLEVDRLHLVLYGKSIWWHHKDLFPTDEQLEKANDVIEEFRARNTRLHVIGGNFDKTIYVSDGCPKEEESIFKDRSVCNAGRFGLTLLPNGEISICEQLSYDPEIVIGDVKTQSIKEAWVGEKMMHWLTPPPRNIFSEDIPCYSCEEHVYDKCHRVYSRCIRDSYHYFGSLNFPDIKCPFAVVKEFRIS